MYRHLSVLRVPRRAVGRGRCTAGAALVLAAVVALTGCSTSSSEGAATDGGRTVLKVYGWKGGDTEPANITKVNAAFEKAHPDVKVDFEFVPANNVYTQRVQPELLAGNSADVIMTDSSKVADWGSAGYLEDLTASSWTSSVLPVVAPFTSSDHKTYALPMEIIGIDLYANTDLLKKAGVTAIPTTSAEFLDALQRVKDAGITPLVLPNKNAWTGGTLLNVIAATRVYQKNPNWDADFVAGKASFEDWRGSVEQLLELQDKGFVNYKNELGIDEWTQGLADFTSAKGAFWLQGAWNQSAVEKAGVNDVFVPWPGGDAGSQPAANLFVGTMWSINAKSKVKAAAKEYVDFWAGSENAAPYVQSENAVSPFTNGTTPSTPASQAFVAAFNAGHYRILPSNSWSDAKGENTMQQAVQQLQLGQVNVDEFLSGLDKKLRTK